jgi:hypothetical protein
MTAPRPRCGPPKRSRSPGQLRGAACPGSKREPAELRILTGAGRRGAGGPGGTISPGVPMNLRHTMERETSQRPRDACSRTTAGIVSPASRDWKTRRSS